MRRTPQFKLKASPIALNDLDGMPARPDHEIAIVEPTYPELIEKMHAVEIFVHQSLEEIGASPDLSVLNEILGRYFLEWDKFGYPIIEYFEINKIVSYCRDLFDFIYERLKSIYCHLYNMEDGKLFNLAMEFKSMAHGKRGPDGSARIFLEIVGLSYLLAPTPQVKADFETASILDTAPEIFRERGSKSENAHDFIQRVYGEWLTGEFTRADLRRLDRSAMVGLANWERVNGRSTLNLPTLKERNDRKTEHFEVTPEVREYRRLQSARQRRTKNL